MTGPVEVSQAPRPTWSSPTSPPAPRHARARRSTSPGPCATTARRVAAGTWVDTDLPAQAGPGPERSGDAAADRARLVHLLAGLDAGVHYTRTERFTLPAHIEGGWQVGVTTDAANTRVRGQPGDARQHDLRRHGAPAVAEPAAGPAGASRHRRPTASPPASTAAVDLHRRQPWHCRDDHPALGRPRLPLARQQAGRGRHPAGHARQRLGARGRQRRTPRPPRAPSSPSASAARVLPGHHRRLRRRRRVPGRLQQLRRQGGVRRPAAARRPGHLRGRSRRPRRSTAPRSRSGSP